MTGPRGGQRDSVAPAEGRDALAGMDPAKPGPLKHLWTFFGRPDPPWWIPPAFAALVIASAVVVATAVVDNQRANRENEHEAAAQNQAQVLENLRFVREYAASRREAATSEHRPGAGQAAGGSLMASDEPCPPPRDANAAAVRLQPFDSINLSGQNLAFFQLPNTNFARANFDGGRLVGIVFAPDSDLGGASLLEASLVDGDLGGVSLVNTDLINADLFGVNLCNASLAGAKLQGANLSSAILTGVDFRNANGEWVPQAGAPDLGFVVRGKVNLSGADLAGADLTGATNLGDAMLYNVYYDETTKWPAGFQPQPSRAKRCLRAESYSDPDNPCLTGEEPRWPVVRVP